VELAIYGARDGANIDIVLIGQGLHSNATKSICGADVAHVLIGEYSAPERALGNRPPESGMKMAQSDGRDGARRYIVARRDSFIWLVLCAKSADGKDLFVSQLAECTGISCVPHVLDVGVVT